MAHIELIGNISTVIAIIGVIANNNKERTCFFCWLLSNTLSAFIHLQTGVTSLLIRDVIFFVLAIHGLKKWGEKGK